MFFSKGVILSLSLALNTTSIMMHPGSKLKNFRKSIVCQGFIFAMIQSLAFLFGNILIYSLMKADILEINTYIVRSLAKAGVVILLIQGLTLLVKGTRLHNLIEKRIEKIHRDYFLSKVFNQAQISFVSGIALGLTHTFISSELWLLFILTYLAFIIGIMIGYFYGNRATPFFAYLSGILFIVLGFYTQMFHIL